jgi:hypothetical protein
MLTYPEAMLAISSQHRKEMLDEAQRWRLVQRARRGRRGRHTAADDAGHDIRAGAQPDAARRGRIAGWVAAGGRGRVDIAPNPSTRSRPPVR